MKVVYLAEVMGVGGLPNYVIQLANAYRSIHPSMEPVIAHMGDKIGDNLETAGLNFVRVNTPQDIAALNPDIIHIHLLSDNDMIEGLLALGIPLIRSFHDYTSTCLRRGKRRWPGDRCQRPVNLGCAAFGCIISPPRNGSRLPSIANLPEKMHERDLYTEFDAVIAGSRHIEGMLLKNGFSKERIYTIPYFSLFANEQVVPQEKCKNGKVEMLFTGQAVAGKGLEVLIESLAGLTGGWHLTVYSEGARLDAAKEKAKANGTYDHISFSGWVNHSALREAYSNSDVMIVPSIWDDPGPLVGIEALSLGTPVVGFAVGGLPDYVITGETGYLVTDISIQGLHNALQTAIDEKDKLTSMGIGALNRVAAYHTPAYHIEATEKIYTKLLQNPRKAAKTA